MSAPSVAGAPELARATPVAPCRVTVAGPAARVDISLPPQATVAELVPQLVRMASDAKRAATGWTLGRLGGEPFDDASTVASAGIRDGEVLYLYPQDGQPLPLLFDDVTDVVADAVTRGPLRWSPTLTRRAGLAVCLVTFAVLTTVIAMAWPLLGGGFAFALLLLGAFLSRGPGDVAAGTTAAAAGLPGFALAAAQLIAGPAGWDAAHLTAGCAAALIYTLFATTIVIEGWKWFAGLLPAAGTGCLAAAVPMLTGGPAASSAAILVAVALLGAAAMPGIALRLSRVPLPRPPADTSALRADERLPAGAEVAASATSATYTLTSLLAGLVALILGGVGVLLVAAPRWSLALVVLSGLALLLRARAYINAGQRSVLLLGGGLTLAAAGAWLVLAGGQTAQAAVFAALLFTGATCLTRAVRSQTTPSPYWSRLLDILEVVVLVSLLPVALTVLDVYALARGATG